MIVISGSLKDDNAVTNRMVVILMFVPLTAKTIKQQYSRIWKPKGKYINAYFNMVEEISRDFRKGYDIK